MRWRRVAPDWGSNGRQQYAPAAADHYATPQHVGYQHEQYAAPEYDSGTYYQDDVPGAQAQHDYDDVPPPRRRTAMLAIAAVVMLAVVGTAGAYGYRALFGSSGTSPPPVIKADTTPTKVVPSAKSEASSNKLIYDRVGDRNNATQEKIVSREEQPVDIKDAKPAQVSLFPSAVGNANASVTPASASPFDQPKKVHTIAIRPDQPGDAPATASASGATAAARTPPARPAAQSAPPPTPARSASAPQRLASAPPSATADAEDPPPARPAAPRPAPHGANAPLSLAPDATPARTAPPSAPARTASIPRSTAGVSTASAAGHYAVQVSSQRSEAEAQAAFRSLQGKYPSQLGGREPIIRRADLGSKGTYYRAMVGPFASSGEASTLCQSLKSAGGSCLIQKN